MGYRIAPREPVQDEVRRIAREQIAKAVGDAGRTGDDLHKGVHEVRKRCKKIRGLVRLVRPAFPSYKDENRRFRDIARRLSDLRDATSLIESVEALSERYEGELDPDEVSRLRDDLEDMRDAAAEEEGARARLDRAGEEMAEARKSVAAWALEEEGYDAVRGGLGKTYRRARERMADASSDPTTEALHEWRKRAKYHRYHVRLLEPVWPPVMGPRRDELKRLTDLLGDDHDLAMLREALVGNADRFGGDTGLRAVLGIAGLRRKELQATALTLGERLFAEPPSALVRRLGGYWDGAVQAGRLEAVLDDRAVRTY